MFSGFNLSKLIMFTFLFLSAFCAGIFLSILFSGLYYDYSSLLNFKVILMLFCLLSASFSFYFLGYKALIKKSLLGLFFLSFSVNFYYCFFFQLKSFSLIDLNLIGFFVLAIFVYKRFELQ